MEINKEIVQILKDNKIDKDAGVLVLLGIYFKLDVDTVCPEEVVKAVNITKIVEKDYKVGVIKWNIPLFVGQEVNWSWVKEWNDNYAKTNPSRKGALSDVTKRMQEFFGKYPQYRKDDVYKATSMYMQITQSEYLKSSERFIFDGAGAMKKSILLSWCEKLKDKPKSEDVI